MNVLFVANYGPNTGYAWETIETVLRGVGERLTRDGHHVHVAYAKYPGMPSRPMIGAPFTFFGFDYGSTGSFAGALRFARLLRSRRISILYLTDRTTWSLRYVLFRAFGVRRIIIHERTSGDRDIPARPQRLIKLLLHRSRLLSADCCVAISRFVARRLIHVNLMPAARVQLVYNGIEITRFRGGPRDKLQRELKLSPDTPIVFCSSRAQSYKGIQVLVEAAARLQQEHNGKAAFVYCGDGPFLRDLREQVAQRRLHNFYLLGARTDVPELIQGATISVVPSLWAEAFGLSVVEAMAAGVPVVASRTGGIPELLEIGGGLLFEPGDSVGLAIVLQQLLSDKTLRDRLGAAGARNAAAHFSLERVTDELYDVFRMQAGGPPTTTAPTRTLRPESVATV